MANYIKDLRSKIGSTAIIMTGANVIIIDSDNKILMHLRRDSHLWGLPGGAMELGESLEDTARREVFEEVGLTCNKLELFNVYSGPDFYYQYPDGNEVYNVTVTYLCRDYSGTIEVEQSEGIKAVYFDVSSIPNLLSPPIKPIIDDYLSYCCQK